MSYTALPHGPFAPGRLCCPSHPRYYGPIRQSQGHLQPRCTAACVPGSLTPRPSLLWTTTHSPGATTSAPEPTMTALARFLRHRPLAFAPGRGLGSCSVPRHFPIPTGRPVDAYSVRSPLRPQILLAPLSDPTILRQPRGLLPELPREMVAHPLRQVLLRSQTGQLLRRDFHPHGWCRYRLHPPGERHSSRCGPSGHESVVPAAAWRPPTAVAGAFARCPRASAREGCWVRSCRPCPRASLHLGSTTAGTSPSSRFHDLPRYYDPLGLPLRGRPFRLRLIGRTRP